MEHIAAFHMNMCGFFHHEDVVQHIRFMLLSIYISRDLRTWGVVFPCSLISSILCRTLSCLMLFQFISLHFDAIYFSENIFIAAEGAWTLEIVNTSQKWKLRWVFRVAHKWGKN